MNTALITGASSGIGAAFAKELAARQSDLVLVARSQDKLESLAQQLEKEYKIHSEVIIKDLTQPSASQEIFDQVSQKKIAIDLLINNAGFGDYGAFTDRNLAKQTQMIQLNIIALVELTHLFLAEMKPRKSGNIINIASIAGYQPLPYLSVYAATKAFVLNFTEALWAENKDSGINILALCPGPTESEFFKVAEFPQSFAGKDPNNYQGYATAEDVVKQALKALTKNQINLVTGGLGNNIIVNLPRFLPRSILVSAVEKQFRQEGK